MGRRKGDAAEGSGVIFLTGPPPPRTCALHVAQLKSPVPACICQGEDVKEGWRWQREGKRGREVDSRDENQRGKMRWRSAETSSGQEDFAHHQFVSPTFIFKRTFTYAWCMLACMSTNMIGMGLGLLKEIFFFRGKKVEKRKYLLIFSNRRQDTHNATPNIRANYSLQLQSAVSASDLNEKPTAQPSKHG